MAPMKIRHLAGCVLLAGCAGQQAANRSGDAAMAQDMREVEEAIQGFESALRAGNFEAVAAWLDPNVLILESGGAERSREEYLASHARADAEFLKSVRGTENASTLKIRSDLAWATKTSELHFDREGVPAVADAAETMILRRGPDGWKIVHIHWSTRERK
jgi:ketosteroid isomerase-like protein